jgi:hypothetical protein
VAHIIAPTTIAAWWIVPADRRSGAITVHTALGEATAFNPAVLRMHELL